MFYAHRGVSGGPDRANGRYLPVKCSNNSVGSPHQRCVSIFALKLQNLHSRTLLAQWLLMRLYRNAQG